MNQFIIFIIILFIAVLFSIPAEKERRRRLNKYWMRSCTGKKWKQQFPEVPKEEIRDFLENFVFSFAFNSKKRLKFEPDDKVMEVYRALYQKKWEADALEFEFLEGVLKKEYGLKLEEIWYDDMTLGQIFKLTRDVPNHASVKGSRLRI